MRAINNRVAARILDRQWPLPGTLSAMHGFANGLAYSSTRQPSSEPASQTEVALSSSLTENNKHVLAMRYGIPVTSLGENAKPWMAMIYDVPITGYAGDYGVLKIWSEGIHGQGVKVGVNDTGLVRGHADFDYSRVDRDSYFFDPGEKKSPAYWHGTAVAGVVGAQANGLGVVGVAHKSTLWTGNLDSIFFVRRAILAACDVVNYSWVPGGEAPIGQLPNQPLYGYELDQASLGRDGRGMSLVFSAGNGASAGADTALQVTTYHENVITVAAVSLYTKVTDQSSAGETVHAAAPGDRLAVADADDLRGHSLREKSGTSYAAPFVAGVVALMYQANAELGLRDVQEILAHSASLPRSGMDSFSFNGGRHANGGGLPFSRYYGFGLVNAHRAVRLAQSWFAGGRQAQTPGNRQYTESGAAIMSAVDNHHGSMFSIAGPRETEHVKLRLDLSVSDIKDLQVVLMSPRGTKSVLMDNYGNQNCAFNNTIELGSRRFWGEDVAGDWLVSISSHRGSINIRSATLVFSGGAETRDDRYIFTDAFNALALADPQRLLLEDSDGGTDTFNAASLTSNAVIDLRAGEFSFANGPRGRIAAGTVIETVVGGDGHDRLAGAEHVAHALYGGRGDDTLVGGAANDTLDGGLGADVMEGGAGNDTYVVDAAGDLVFESASDGIDTVRSSVSYVLAPHLEELVLSGNASINGGGNELGNLLRGNDADNQLDGGYGSDTLIGGEGNDIYYVRHGDLVVEEALGGLDSVIADVSWTLGAHLEDLILAGADAINASGNALDNILVGNNAGNVLSGGDGNDVLEGAAGDDLLEGGAGNDSLGNWAGAALFNGGTGNDILIGGSHAELFLGGRGTDSVSTGIGDDIILFNAGDGQDVLSAGGSGRKMLSLGGSLAYSELSLSKVSQDLVLKMGAADQISFQDWYAATPSRPRLTLQVIAEAMGDFEAGGSDPLRDQKVEQFDFSGLAGAFDAAQAANRQLSNWALSNALLNFQLAGSDSAAIGGDLAYHYGRHGTLAGIGLDAAQNVIGDSRFGAQAQILHPLAELQSGPVRLS